MAHNKRPNIENFDIYTESPNFECYVSMAELLRPKKKPKKKQLSTLLPLVICIPREQA